MKTNNKVVYIITTQKCSACKCMKYILNSVKEEDPTFTITTTDFTDVPEWISTNISLSDFPTVIFVKDNIIKHYFTGTLSKNKIIKLMSDINF